MLATCFPSLKSPLRCARLGMIGSDNSPLPSVLKVELYRVTPYPFPPVLRLIYQTMLYAQPESLPLAGRSYSKIGILFVKEPFKL